MSEYKTYEAFFFVPLFECRITILSYTLHVTNKLSKHQCYKNGHHLRRHFMVIIRYIIILHMGFIDNNG